MYTHLERKTKENLRDCLEKLLVVVVFGRMTQISSSLPFYIVLPSIFCVDSGGIASQEATSRGCWISICFCLYYNQVKYFFDTFYGLSRAARCSSH